MYKKSATSGWEVALGGVIRDDVITTLRRLFLSRKGMITLLLHLGR